MPRYEDLTGKIFGRLKVLEVTEKKNKDGRRMWKCQCECGNIKITSCQNLKRGHCTSCGCKNKEQITALGHSNSIDITNKRFGKLVAIKKSKDKIAYSNSIPWVCQCDCGNKIIATVSALNSGNTTSCGCHKSEGEELIKQILTNEKVLFLTESWISELKSKKGKPLQFDFYLPQYNCYIEFDGEQHYKINKYFSKENYERDCLKNEYCLLHNIKLYRIPYSYKEKLKKEKWTLQDLLNDNFLVKQIDHYNLQKII